MECVVDGLARQYYRQGHNVTVVSADSGNETPPQVPWTCVYIPCLNPFERFDIPYPLFNPVILFRELWRIIEGADVVHLHGVLTLSSLLAGWMARRTGVKVVLTEHVGFVKYDNWAINLIQLLAIRIIGRTCIGLSNVVAVTNSRVMSEIKPFLTNQLLVKILHGVDTNFYSPPPEAKRSCVRRSLGLPETPVVLFAGRRVKR